MDNDSSSPLSPTDGSFNSLSQDETNLSREDKVALARKRLQQFQKKRKTSNSQLSATSAKESSRRTSETNAVNSRPTSAVSVTTRPLINDHVLQSPALPVTEPYEPSLHEEDIDGQPTIIYNPKLAGTLTPEEQQAIDEIIHSRPTTANGRPQTERKVSAAIPNDSSTKERIEYLERINEVLTKENQTLIRSLNELKLQLEEKSSSLAHSGNAVMDQQSTVAGLHSQLQSLKQALDDKDQVLESVQSSYKSAQSEISQLSQELSSEKKKNASAKTEFEVVENELRLLKAELHNHKQTTHQSTQEQNHNYELRIVQLQKKCTESNDALKQMQSELRAKDSKLQEVSEQMANNSLVYQQEMSEMRKAATKANEEQKKLQQLRAEYDGLKMDSQKQVQLLTTELEAVKSELKDIREKNLQLETSHNDATSKWSQAQVDLNRLTGELKVSRKWKAEVDRIKADYASLIEEKDKEIQLIQSQAQTEMVSLKEEIRGHQAFHSTAKDLQKALEESNYEKKNLEDVRNTLQNNLRQVTQELEKCRSDLVDLAKLKTERESLLQKLDGLEQALAQSNSQMNTLRNAASQNEESTIRQIQTSQSEIVRLKSELNAVQAENGNLKVSFEKQKHELELKLNHLAESEIVLKKQLEETSSALQSAETFKTELGTLKELAIKTENDLSTKEKEVLKLTSELKVIAKEKKLLEVKLLGLESELSDANSGLEKANVKLEQYQTYETDLQKAKHDVSELNRKVETSAKEIEARKTELESAYEQIRNLELVKSEYSSMHQETANTLSQLKQLSIDFENEKRVHLDTKEKLKDAELLIKKLEEVVSETESNNSEFLKQMADMEKTTKFAKEERDIAIQAVKEIKRKMSDQNSSFEKEKRELQTSLNHVLGAMEELKSDIASKESQVQLFTTKTADDQAVFVQLRSETSMLKEALGAARAQLEEKEDSFRILSTKYDRLEAQWKQVHEKHHLEIESLHSTLKTTQTEWESELKHTKEELQIVKHNLSDAKKHIKELETSQSTLKADMKALKKLSEEKDLELEDSKLAFSRLKTERDERIADLKSQIASLQKELKESQDDSEEKAESIKRNIAHEYLQEISSLKEQLHRLEAAHQQEKAKFSSELSLKNNNVQKLQDDVEEKRAQIKALDTTLTKLKESMLKSKDARVDQVTRELTNQIEALKVELSRQTAESIANEKTNQSVIDGLNSKIQQLQQENDKNQQSFQDLLKKVNHFEAQDQSIRELIAEGQALLSRAPGSPRSPSFTVEQRLATVLDGLRDEIIRLKDNLDKTERRCSTLEPTVVALEQQKGALEKEYNLLKQDCVELRNKIDSAAEQHNASLSNLNEKLILESERLRAAQARIEEYEQTHDALLNAKIAHEKLQGQTSKAIEMLNLLTYSPDQAVDLNIEKHASETGLTKKVAEIVLSQRRIVHELTGKVKEITAQREDLSLRYQRLVNDVDSSATNVKTIIQEKEEMGREISHLQNLLENTSGELKKVAEAVKQKNVEIEEMGRQIQGLQQERESLSTQNQKGQNLVSLEKTARRELELEFVKMGEEHQKLKESLEKERESASSTIDMMEQLLFDERERSKRLSDSVEHLKNTLSERASMRNGGPEDLVLFHEHEKDELHRVLDLTKKRTDETLKENEKLKDAVQQIELELAKEKDANVEIVNFVREILGTLPDSSLSTKELFSLDALRLLEKFKLEISLLTRRGYGTGKPSVESLEHHMLQLKNRVIELQSENQNLRKQLEEAKLSIEDAQSLLTQLDNQKRLDQLRSISPDPPLDNRTIEQYEKMIRNLKDQLRDSDKMIGELRDSLETLDRRHRAFSEAKDERIQELEKLVENPQTQEPLVVNQPPMLKSSGLQSLNSPGAYESNRYAMELSTEMESLRLRDLKSASQIETMAFKIQECETALRQAEKTIDILNQNLKDKSTAFDTVRREKDALQSKLDRLNIHNPSEYSEKSPDLEVHMEEILQKTTETMKFIDDIGKLASSKTQPSPTVVVPVEKDKDLMDILKVIKSQVVTISNSADESLRQLFSGDGDSKALNLGHEMKSQRETMHLLTQLCDKAIQMANSHVNQSSNRSSQQLSIIVNPLKLKLAQESMDALLKENENEIQTLRDAVLQMTQSEKNRREMIGRDTEQNLETALLHSHVQQLRNIWDHEVKANEVLRRIVSELRSRFSSLESEFHSQVELMQQQTDLLNIRVQETQAIDQNHLDHLQEKEAARRALERELATLKATADHQRREWQVERAEILTKVEKLLREVDLLKGEKHHVEQQWQDEKQHLLCELNDAHQNAHRLQEGAQKRSFEAMKRITDDFSRKEGQMKREKDSLVHEVQTMRKQLETMQYAHEREKEEISLERRLIEKASVEDAVKSKESVSRDMQRRHREEKEDLLRQFKSKMNEFQDLHDQQQRIIEKLKEEKATVIAERDRILKAGVAPDDRLELLSLQKEIISLKEQQRLLNENLMKEKMSVDAYYDMDRELQRKIRGKDAQAKKLQHNLFHNRFGRSSTEDMDGMDHELMKERDRHKEHCRMLTGEITVMRLKYKREAGQNSDMKYQKHFLVLLLGGFEACVSRAAEFAGPCSLSLARLRWKKALWSVLALCRMRLLKRKWTVIRGEIKQHQSEIKNHHRNKTPSRVNSKARLCI